MNRRAIIKNIGIVVFCSLIVNSIAVASEFKCQVCGMSIKEHGRNHILLRNGTQKKSLHVCSASCAKKMRKYDSSYSDVQVTNFNHPEKMLQGDKAYFLIQSSKIKSDMGENVMAPYAAAFSTKEEADAAQKKYGDGVVLKGADNAFK